MPSDFTEPAVADLAVRTAQFVRACTLPVENWTAWVHAANHSADNLHGLRVPKCCCCIASSRLQEEGP